MMRTCPFCGSVRTRLRDRPSEWECDECKRRFPDSPEATTDDPTTEQQYRNRTTALADHPGWIDAIERNWPGPIAHTQRLLRKALRNGQVDSAALIFRDFAELIGRLSALVLAQDLRSNATAPPAKEILQALFGAPQTMGVWIQLADQWARDAQREARSLVFPEIAGLWRTPGGKRTQFHALLRDGITQWRNETIGHGVRGADQGPLLDDLERFLGDRPPNIHVALLPFADLWNGTSWSDASGRSLMGTDAIDAAATTGHDPQQSHMILLKRGARELALHPWISMRHCPVCGRRETFLYDSTRVRGTAPNFRLSSYESGHAFELPGAADLQMRGDYYKTDKPSVDARSGFEGDSIDDEIATLLEQQSFEADYLSPGYLRDALRDFVEATTDAPTGGVLWLRAPAHVGKSTFVRGLDPRSLGQLKEDPLIDGLAVAIFHIRREYQHHLAQFADQLRDTLRTVLNIRAQRARLPSLDIDTPGPEKFCAFLRSFQRLADRNILVVIDGLDELPEHEPGIADLIPPASLMPARVALMVTSRLPSELPAWLQAKSATLQSSTLLTVDLAHAGYVSLMNDYARRTISRAATSDPSLPERLRQASGERFAHFAFLVQRVRDGRLDPANIARLAAPEQLVPQYIDALFDRYGGTATGDLLQRTLLWITLAEEAYIRHDMGLPALIQTAWEGLPMRVLCKVLEAQPDMTPRLAYVLYLLKPLLVTFRGEQDSMNYRLGIKDLASVIRGSHSEALDEMLDKLIARLLTQQEDHDASLPREEDLEWMATHLDGLKDLLPVHRQRAWCLESTSRQTLERLLRAFIKEGDQERKSMRLRSALSRFCVAHAIIEWCSANALPQDERLAWLRTCRLQVLNNSGIALIELGDGVAARGAYTAAIEILTGLAAPRNSGAELDLASAYMNRALAANAFDSRAALADFSSAIELCEALRRNAGAGELSDELMETLAHAYLNRGLALNDSDRPAALADYDQGLSYLVALRQRPGNASSPDLMHALAVAHLNRGLALSANDLHAARLAYEQAIALWDDIQQKHGALPPRMVSDMARTYVNLGFVLSVNDAPAALKADEEAIALCKSLVDGTQAEFVPGHARDLAVARLNRGNVLNTLGLPGAIDDYDAAIALLERLEARLGDQFTPDMAHSLATCHMNRGSVLSAAQTADALTAYGRAIKIGEMLRTRHADEFTGEMQTQLAQTYMDRGMAHASMKEWAGALADLDESISLLEALRRDDKSRFGQDMTGALSLAYLHRGDVSYSSGEAGGAAGYDMAIRLIENLPVQGSSLTPDLTDTLALAYQRRGEQGHAEDTQARALAGAHAISLWEGLRQSMGAKLPPGIAGRLSYAWLKRGLTLRAIDGSQALEALKRAIVLYEEMRLRYAGNLPGHFVSIMSAQGAAPDRLSGEAPSESFTVGGQRYAITAFLQEKLGKDDSDHRIDQLAWTHANLGATLLPDVAGAHAEFALATALWDYVRTRREGGVGLTVVEGLVFAYLNRGLLSRDSDDSYALCAFEEVIEIVEKIQKQAPEHVPAALAHALGLAYLNCGVILKAKDEARMVDSFTRAIAVWSALPREADGLGAEMTDNLALAHFNRGHGVREMDPAAALEDYDACIELWEGLRRGPVTPAILAHLALAYTNRAQMLANDQNKNRFRSYASAVAIVQSIDTERRFVIEPELVGRLAAACETIGDELGAVDRALALAAIAQAVALWEVLFQRMDADFGRANAQHLAHIYMNYGSMLYADANPSATDAFARAVAYWEAACQDCGEHFDDTMASNLAEARRRHLAAQALRTKAARPMRVIEWLARVFSIRR